MAHVKQKRPYRSARRQEQAASTRSAIIEAATRVFARRGYSGTTIEAIAKAAGVAAITVYSTFGSKGALLAHLVGVAVVGDQEPIPLLERSGPQRVLRAGNQRSQVRLFAEDISGILQRAAPLMEVASQAARTDAEIARLLRTLLGQRLANMKVFTAALERNGPLRDGLSSGRAAETVWAVSSPEIYLLTRRHLGWTQRQWVDWLDQVIAGLLLAPISEDRARGRR